LRRGCVPHVCSQQWERAETGASQGSTTSHPGMS
jgi:hypothetical protein